MDFDNITQIPPKSSSETKTVDHPRTRKEMREYAEEQIDKWLEDDWTFKFSGRMKKSVGMCRWNIYKGKREIKVSSKWFIDIGMDRLVEEGVEEDFFEDTILHEIAHALDVEDRRTSDHSWKWKEKARKVGANPERTCDLPKKLEKLLATWKRVCTNCGKEVYYYKKPHSNRNKACGKCCNKHNGGKFSNDYILEVRKNNPVI